MNFSSFKKLLLRPEDFFNSVKSERGWKKPFFTLVLSFILYVFFVLVLSFVILSGLSNIASSLDSVELSAQVQQRWIEAIFSLITMGVFVLVMPLLIPVTHFIATKFGGKGTKDDTAKAILYPNVPAFVLGWFPLIGGLLWIWSLYLWYIGFKTLHKMSKKQFLLFATVEAILSIVLFIIISILVAGVLLFFGVPLTEF